MTDRLFLDDLHVGQRFTSTSYVVDADQIKRFRGGVRPTALSPPTRTPRPNRCCPVSRPAAGTPPP